MKITVQNDNGKVLGSKTMADAEFFAMKAEDSHRLLADLSLRRN